MLERLWFSLCAVAAVLSFVFGAVVIIVVIGAVFDGRRLQWDALAIGWVFTILGPLAARFAYRWGLWVARGSG